MNNIRIPIPKVPFNPPVYVAKKVTEPFCLDGNIFKPFWENIPFTEEFLDIEGPQMPKPRFSTRAKIAYDDKNIYFACLLNGNEIWANQTERDSVIFYDNDFEIFIDPDSDTQQYYEFEMNARNTVWDLLLTKAYRDLGKPVNCFDIHGIQTAVHIDGKLNSLSNDNHFWSCEVVIPFASVCECTPSSMPPKPFDYYRLNFSRVQWKVFEKEGKIEKVKKEGTNNPLPEDNWVYAPTGVINIHYPELWGFLVFGDSDLNHKFEIPAEEYVKWELRKLYYAENIYFDINARYTDDYSELLGILERFSPIDENRTVCLKNTEIFVTPHSYEIKCKTDQNKEISIFSDGKTIIY